MTINFSQSRQCLQDFEFSNLFIQQLGWSSPSTNKSASMQVEGETYSRKPISQLLGVVVFEITAANGEIPNATKRLAIYQEIAELVRENVLIFIDKQRTQCVWYWVKREGSKAYPRDHVYVKREPCDLLLSKVSALYVSLEELDSISVTNACSNSVLTLSSSRLIRVWPSRASIFSINVDRAMIIGVNSARRRITASS